MDPLDEAGLGTRAVWSGEQAPGWEGATQVPVAHSVSFGYDDVDAWMAVGRGEAPGHIYSRNSNPTVAAFTGKVRALEGAEAAVGFATGMAAISAGLFTLLAPGHRVVSITGCYGGTSLLFTEFLPRFDVDVTLCDTTDQAAIEAAVERGCDLLYLETPTNPTLELVDITALATAGHAVGAVVVVDNTLATPVNQQPLELGADLSVHNATKFLGGHAEALGGVVCGAADVLARIDRFREITGGALDPGAAYLLLRGLKTLHLRVARQNDSAQRIAGWLREHPAVTAVHYPGLGDHPQHQLARRQMRGFGGVLSFEVHGGLDGIRAFLPRLAYAHRAANLGAVETVAGPPATTSHVECTPDQREALGIPEGLVRYSVGIEDPEDLIADLDQALGSLLAEQQR